MAMTPSVPHPDEPYRSWASRWALKFERVEWEAAGLLAIVGMGVEPGLSDVFARYAADHLFSSIDEVGVRDGANLEVDGYEFAPTFSIWTTIEECLNPPIVYDRARRVLHDRAVLGAGDLRLPRGDRPGRVRERGARGGRARAEVDRLQRVTFKYGLGDEFINVLRVLHAVGLDRVDPVRVGDVEVSPRDLVAACLPTRRTSATRCTARRAPART